MIEKSWLCAKFWTFVLFFPAFAKPCPLVVSITDSSKNEISNAKFIV